MEDTTSARTDTSDDEFETEDVNEDESTTLERLSQFAYYMVENFEVNLNFCLSLLEERPVPDKPNSTPTSVISKLLSGIPKVGSAVGNALSKGEIVIFNKIDKKNSRILADLVYYYSDNKNSIRMLLIESAIDIFCSFEHQFRKLTCNGGPKRAMQKLAKDASDRIFNYFLETEQKRDITRTEITKGVLLGDSKRNQKGVRDGNTVINKETNWKTSKMYKKTGIVIVEEQTFFKNKETHTEKYGHRRMLPWEQSEDIKNNWEREDGFEVPHYYLPAQQELTTIIRDYIMSKNPVEQAKLERENYHNEAAEDRKVKHELLLIEFQDNFKQLLEDLEHQYSIVAVNHQENKELLNEISKNQDARKDLNNEISTKLLEIQKSICETKVLIETQKAIQEEMLSNARREENTSVVTITPEEIKEIIKEEAAANTEQALTNAIRETLRKNDPGPRIKKEINRNIKKIKKLF